MKKRLAFCRIKTLPTTNKILTSKNKERIVDASASIIELASVKREITSPVRLVAKKGHGQFKNVTNIRQNHVNR